MREKIVFLSDPHIGIKSNWKVDKGGLPLKVKDNLDRFHWILDSLDETEVSLVVIGGDFFDHYHTDMNVVVKTMKIIRRIGKKNIGVIIIGGNHDNTSNFSKKERLDVINSLPNCMVFRSFTSINFTTETINGYYGANSVPQFNAWWKRAVVPDLASKQVGLVLLPFMSMRGLADLYYKKNVEEQTGQPFTQSVRRDQLELFLGNIMIEEKMIGHISNCSNKIMIGHYQLVGSRMHDGQEPMLNARELHFSKEMVKPDLFDFIGFGHIHLPQSVWGNDTPNKLWKIQHIGASDRFRFDERDDSRRYLVYDCNSKDITAISLDPNIEENRPQVRFMIQEEVDVPLGDPNPNKMIINSLINNHDESKLKSSNVKIVINIHAEDSVRYNRKKIREEIEELVFYLDYVVTNIIRVERNEDFKNVKERSMIDLPQVLDDFLSEMQLNTKKDDDVFAQIYPKLSAMAHEILKKAMETEEK